MLMIICFYILLAESILLICLCVPNIRTMIARNFESMSMAEIKPFVSAGSVGAALIGLGSGFNLVYLNYQKQSAPEKLPVDFYADWFKAQRDAYICIMLAILFFVNIGFIAAAVEMKRLQDRVNAQKSN